MLNAQAILIEFLLMKELPGLSYQAIQKMDVKEVGAFFTLLGEYNKMQKEAAEKGGNK